jgi:predicted short-subunit dehydrogenase-like oxidoreductase (DUF2520 family)
VLAERLGLRPLVVPSDGKALYHAAASIASNYLVALLDLAQQALGSFDGPADALEVLLPLVQGTLANVMQAGAENALTGPIVRGDIETVRSHCLALRKQHPHLLPAYAVLGVATVDVALRSGRLQPEVAARMLGVLEPLSAPSSPA